MKTITISNVQLSGYSTPQDQVEVQWRYGPTHPYVSDPYDRYVSPEGVIYPTINITFDETISTVIEIRIRYKGDSCPWKYFVYDGNPITTSTTTSTTAAPLVGYTILLRMANSLDAICEASVAKYFTEYQNSVLAPTLKVYYDKALTQRVQEGYVDTGSSEIYAMENGEVIGTIGESC